MTGYPPSLDSADGTAGEGQTIGSVKTVSDLMSFQTVETGMFATLMKAA